MTYTTILLGTVILCGFIFYICERPKAKWIQTGFYEWRCKKIYRSGISEWEICREDKDINDPKQRLRYVGIVYRGGLKYSKECPTPVRANDPHYLVNPLPPRLSKV